MVASQDRGLSPVPLEALQDEGLHDSRNKHQNTSPSFPPAPIETNTVSPPREEPVTWLSLPHKSQLAILFLARLSEPITQTSLQSYLYHQLASFEPDAPGPVIASRVGFVVAAFPATQAVTSVLWGVAADSPRIGRKLVIVIGLLGTAAGSIGYGLSLNWQTAMFWRAFSGVLNGNVGVMRTMISEIIKEKKYQSRAFLLLPLCFNIGTVIGPLLGGRLSEPVESFPGLFGPGSVFGGEEGVYWMQHWPYALPNFVSAVFLTSAAIFVLFGLDETHEALRDRKDYPRIIGGSVSRFFQRLFKKDSHTYAPLSNAEPDTPGHQSEFLESSPPKKRKKKHLTTPNKLPINRMWTRNVLANLLSRFLLSLTVGTFQSLWITFLAAPRSTTSSALSPRSILSFSGGLALPPSQIGSAMAILGTIGIILQLTLYPLLSARLGTIGAFRLPLPLFPLTCLLIPFLVLLPSTSQAPEPMSGPILWICLILILTGYVIARTFVLPASAILVNNCAPHPSRLGTLHGVAQSIGSSARFLGPLVGGIVFGAGESMGFVGLAWWCLAGVGGACWAVSFGVREGDGHEILMEGEEKKDGEVVFVGETEGRRIR